jgi:drug/metabolite transporter (DMT)-like permease
MSRRAGIALGFVTACISGVSIWVNSRAVAHFSDATVYTTAKNAVAGVVLLLLLLVPGSHGRVSLASVTRRGWPALLAVAVIGGSVPFVLFFEGLKHSQATQAAFIQKTLVVWVALLAVAAARMALGTVLLVCWLALTGKLGDLTGLSALQWRWALLTGLLLSAYVAAWFAALARAQAIDVTAVLVFGALVTAILSGGIDGAGIGVGGTVLVAVGSGVIAWAALRRPPAEASA